MAYDVIVIGVGGHGSAAAYHLAKRGLRVLALERFSVPHTMGSSHGGNRLLRVAYAEGATYVPLVRRARELWLDLERASGDQIFLPTGSLDIGSPDRGSLSKALATARAFDMAHTVLDPAETAKRFPAWSLDADMAALHQPEGGLVRSETSILAHVRLALARGATVMAHTAVEAIEGIASGAARVVTDRGTFEAAQVVVTAGAWVGKLLPALAAISEVRRISLAFFATRAPDLFAPERFPIWTLDCPMGHFYGAPIDGVPGAKIGGPSSGDQPGRWVCDPDTVSRAARPFDEANMRGPIARYLKAADGPVLGITGCLVTFTPDEDFVIDRVPGLPQVLAISACSGHGYKFASVMGEIAAELVQHGATSHDISRFGLARFGAPT